MECMKADGEGRTPNLPPGPEPEPEPEPNGNRGKLEVIHAERGTEWMHTVQCSVSESEADGRVSFPRFPRSPRNQGMIPRDSGFGIRDIENR
jgi:hypothetical protein